MGNMLHDTGTTGFGPFEFSLGDELRGERATLGKTLLDIQRDLRIKAAYIAAIEDAKPEVFPNPSFIAGYVRSYARYLGMDPDEVFQRFCRESGFTGKAGAGVTSAPKTGHGRGPSARRPAASSRRSPRLDGGLPSIPFAAIGSLAGAGRPDRRARLRRLDGAAEHPARAVRPGRGAAGRRGRGGAARGARDRAARRARLHRPRASR